MRLRAAALAFLFALIACGGDVTTGTVVAKRHEPARTYTYFMPVTTGKTVTLIPMTGFDDEDWILVLERRSDGGERKRGDVSVDRATFESTKVGDDYGRSR